MQYFLDTSALVKRYVNEIGTAWVQTLHDPPGRTDVLAHANGGGRMYRRHLSPGPARAYIARRRTKYPHLISGRLPFRLSDCRCHATTHRSCNRLDRQPTRWNSFPRGHDVMDQQEGALA